MADHEDYLPGEAPAPHKTTHEYRGTDETSIAGLSGTSAALATHALLPTVHQDAPELISEHAAIAAAHHTRYTNGEAAGVAATLIEDHAALPTVHQDAPGLIETHRLVAGAHHTKYTDTEARALHNPISVNSSAFRPHRDTGDFTNYGDILKKRTSTVHNYFLAPVYFPNGVTVTKLTLYGYRDDAAAMMDSYLRRADRVGNLVSMATVRADWTSGYSSAYTTAVGTPVIDNDAYSYFLLVGIDCNDSIDDLGLTGMVIEFSG